MRVLLLSPALGVHNATIKPVWWLPAQKHLQDCIKDTCKSSHRILGCHNNPVLSRNATNNILAVLNAEITLKTTMVPRFCSWPAQCHHHTHIVVTCTRPRNSLAKAHWALLEQSTRNMQCALHLSSQESIYWVLSICFQRRDLLIWMENGKTSSQRKHGDGLLQST